MITLNIKKLIRDYFEKNNQAISTTTLYKTLNLPPSNEDIFLDSLYELEQEGKIIYYHNQYIKVPSTSTLYQGKLNISNKGNYYLNIDNNRIIIPNSSKYSLKVGDIIYVVKKEKTISSNYKKYIEGDIIRVVQREKISIDNFLIKATLRKEYATGKYFIESSTKKIYIKNKNINSAYPGDLVTISFSDDIDNIRVINIIKRKNPYHIFKCVEHNEVKKWIPLGTTYFDIESSPSIEYSQGSLVLAEIIIKNNQYYLNIQKEIKSEYNEVIINSALENNFSLEFNPNSIIEMKKNLSINKQIKRKDLRNLPTITIDSNHAKDLDDAISLEEKNGFYYLYIHIADVSYYIPYGSLLFNESIKKGTSIYPLDSVIPMLPPELSNDICSLNPNIDKLTLTCMVKLDNSGNILDFDIFNSIIKSDYRMTYNEVNDLLLGKDYNYEYLPYYQLLFSMQKLSNIIQNKRIENGSLFLQTSEYALNLDEFSCPISIEENEKGPAQQIIENFMITANKVIADYSYYLDLPFVYRNHEPPSSINLNKLKGEFKKEKIILNKLNSIKNPNLLKKLLVNILTNMTKEEAAYVSEIILKSMTRAYYSDKNIGHYGLGLERYATFTSPIRRGADLLNHYALNAIINYSVQSEEILNHLRKELSKICEHLTEREIASENVERETNFIALKELANNNLKGKLLQVIQKCAFIKIEDSVIGIIHSNNRYVIDFKNERLIDTDDNTIYHIGDNLLLKISNTKNIGSFLSLDIENSKIKKF